MGNGLIDTTEQASTDGLLTTLRAEPEDDSEKGCETPTKLTNN